MNKIIIPIIIIIIIIIILISGQYLYKRYVIDNTMDKGNTTKYNIKEINYSIADGENGTYDEVNFIYNEMTNTFTEQNGKTTTKKYKLTDEEYDKLYTIANESDYMKWDKLKNTDIFALDAPSTSLTVKDYTGKTYSLGDNKEITDKQRELYNYIRELKKQA